ncbi:DNA-binding transcriptional regulator, MarR family [Goodfellowiella coeruleoviolacea]|uniref:DNA-binding transcriptional regulator, MarR family n=1 Tax=Goodfellowiella coeruleoviolacea TaxID=334858 RepID=A0AAE3KH21_9PSEU|nr:DNA-binding transcriptional regulator, MarR family [Goodfellowiella coeruleoviolacea]
MSQLFRAVQDELWRALAEQGFADLGPRHGSVLAYLSPDGVRSTELARRCGQHKQIVGTVVDELEALGYVVRRPDPADRRAKLVVPTERGLAEIDTARRIIRDVENRHAEALGRDDYARFKAALRVVTRQQRQAAGHE